MLIPASVSKNITAEQLSFLNNFFLNCPNDFASNIIFMRYGKNHTLINTGNSCSHVYILLHGRLQAIEENVIDEPYRFTELSAIDIVGDFELFEHTSSSIITLMTIEKSDCIIIPAKAYLQWIKHDANALFIRMQMLIKQLSVQTQFDRQNFFMDNKMRLLYFLEKECHNQIKQSLPYKIRYTRQQIAQKLGCSIRTINRNILSLNQNNIVSLNHGKIEIDQQQYLIIKKTIITQTSLP